MKKEKDKKYLPKEWLLQTLEKGYFGVGKFISLQQRQQEDLLRIIDLLCSYIRRLKVVRPLNIFIQATPGVGKTYLVKQICFTLENTLKERIKYYNFNLSYMRSPDDLISAFRKVQSSNIKNEVPVVFFDEVDAGFEEGKDAYRFFLTPMFEGILYDKGDELHIGKAVLFFAASKEIESLLEIAGDRVKNKNKSYKKWVDGQKQILNEPTKYSKLGGKLIDFLDRIDEYIVLPPPEILFENDDKLINTQSTLLVTAMLLKHFPDIISVDDEVLPLLRTCLLSKPSRRKVDSVIFKSTQSPDGKFRVENLPGSFLEECAD